MLIDSCYDSCLLMKLNRMIEQEFHSRNKNRKFLSSGLYKHYGYIHINWHIYIYSNLSLNILNKMPIYIINVEYK